MFHKTSFYILVCIYSNYSDFKKIIFHKVMLRRSKGVVGYLIIALLQNYHSVGQ